MGLANSNRNEVARSSIVLFLVFRLVLVSGVIGLAWWFIQMMQLDWWVIILVAAFAIFELF